MSIVSIHLQQVPKLIRQISDVQWSRFNIHLVILKIIQQTPRFRLTP